MSADFWLGLQMKYDLRQAQQTIKGLEELELLVNS
jgi:plasmid maintenance system antidote protein VapI